VVRVPAARAQRRCRPPAGAADRFRADAAGERVQRTKTVAQLYFRAGNYSKAAQSANQYLKSAPNDQEAQLLVAQSHFQQKDYKSAVAAANRLIKPGQRPSEDLLQLLLRSNYELKDAAGTSAALEQLLTYYRARTPGTGCSTVTSRRRTTITSCWLSTGSRRTSAR